MTYRPVVGWGQLPENWSFVEATSVAVDASDDVYVFNRGAHPVIVFDRDGNFRRSWGEGTIRRAHGITIGPDGTVWLTDDLHHTARQYTPEGKLLLTIGDPDTPSTLQGGKPFNRPTHVALCPKTGDVYVSDGYGNSRVHKYDPRGRHLFSWGEGGTDLPVSEHVPNLGPRVSMLSARGDLVGRFGGKFRGEEPGEFTAPHGCSVDSRGDLYVAEVAYTSRGSKEHPPREIRSLQKFTRAS